MNHSTISHTLPARRFTLSMLFIGVFTVLGLTTISPAVAQTAIPAITSTPAAIAPSTSASPALPVGTASAANPLTTYRNDQFSVLYPSGWKVTPRDKGALYIGPNGAPACNAPGIILMPVGLLSTNDTPDILLNDFVTINTYLTETGTRVDLGTLGRTVTFEGPCSDGTPRKFRITTYTATSRGFQLEEFAPKADFDQSDPLFLQIAQSFTPLTSTGQQPIVAPKSVPSTLLIHLFQGNVFMAAVGDLPGTPLTRDADPINGTGRYTQPAIAPGGRLIAYIAQPGGDLLIAPLVRDGQAERLPIHAAPHFPIAWRADGSAIAYVDLKGTHLTVNLFSLKDNVVAQVGTLPGGACADAPIADPAAGAWAADLDAVNAAGDTLILAWADSSTLIVSTDCTGAQAVALDIKTGTLRPLAAPGGFVHVALSPDGKTLAGIADGQLALLTLADPSGKLDIRPLPANRVVWNADGQSLITAARGTPQTIALSAAADGFAPFQSANFQLTLSQITFADSKITALYTGYGFAIGTLAATPDGSGIGFSVTQDDSALIKIITKPVGANDIRQAAPLAQLYWLPLPAAPGSSPVLLIDTDGARFGPIGSQAVIGLPVTPPGPDFNNLGG